MAKIMLVEDDNNLREIYEARLLAEGYEIVSARDGEEALALAVKEKPDLIISDIMMPKISGFDMLDILRSTPETKNTKVIMMTALSQSEDKQRAEKLGADKYLVKSQVTLEDVAKAAREVLGDEAPAATTQGVMSSLGPVNVPASVPAAMPVSPALPVSPAPPVTTPPSVSATPPASPISIPVTQSAASTDPTPTPSNTQTTAAEASTIDQQIKDFVAQKQTTSPSTTTNLPASEPVASATPAPVAPAVTPASVAAAPSLGGRRIMVNEPSSSPSSTTSTTTAPGDPISDTSASGNMITPTTPIQPAPLDDTPSIEIATPHDPISQEPRDGAVNGKKRIEPINDIAPKPNINDLLAKETAKVTPPPVSPGTQPPIAPTQPGHVIAPDPNNIAL